MWDSPPQETDQLLLILAAHSEYVNLMLFAKAAIINQLKVLTLVY